MIHLNDDHPFRKTPPVSDEYLAKVKSRIAKLFNFQNRYDALNQPQLILETEKGRRYWNVVSQPTLQYIAGLEPITVLADIQPLSEEKTEHTLGTIGLPSLYQLPYKFQIGKEGVIRESGLSFGPGSRIKAVISIRWPGPYSKVTPEFVVQLTYHERWPWRVLRLWWLCRKAEKKGVQK